MKFNSGECQIRHLGWGIPGCTDRLGNERLESNAAERDLEILTMARVSRVAARRTSYVLGGIRHSTAQEREGIVPLCTEVASLRV